MTDITNPVVAELIARSNRLGSDPKNTNYAGGNTSAKGTEIDPVTGEPVELVWVKGSGGDLGTLTESGLAVLRLDRMRALVDVYPGVEREDEMVAAFDYCLHGKGGAAPSIDTAMHGLVHADHVDHLHPDSGIAIATAADGEQLTAAIYGDKVVWVPWRRPGFELGLEISEIKEKNPQAIGCMLGGHGITAWGETSDEAEQNSLWIIKTAAAYIAEHGEADPFGSVLPGYEALPDAERRQKAAALAPRSAASLRTTAQVGHFNDAEVVLGLPRPVRTPSPSRTGYELPRPLPAHEGKPLVLDLPGHAPVDGLDRAAAELHEEYRADYQAYYDAARARRTRPRSAAPTRSSSWYPGLACSASARQADRPRGRRVLHQRDQRHARRRSALDLRPIPRARSSASSTGRWRRRSSSACRSRSRSPPGSRWSPVPLAASARPSRSAWPPRAHAS